MTTESNPTNAIEVPTQEALDGELVRGKSREERKDPCPSFTPHWADDLFGRIDEVLDLIGQANQEHPITSVELAKKLDLGWEEIWAIVCHLRSVAVPVYNDGYGFWLSEARQP